MTIIKNRKKAITAGLGAAVAAVAAPAMLFLGTGTAQAGGWIENPNADYLGVAVRIHSDGFTYGECLYNAKPVQGVGIPVINHPFHLDKVKMTELWFPGVRLNTTWNVTVSSCDNGAPFGAVVTY